VDLPSGGESTLALQRGLRDTGWTISQLWIAVVGIGGGFHHRDIEDIAAGQRQATPAEHDFLASALNEYFVDHGGNHPVALWCDLPPPF
jgi:hypothetical protein